MDPLRNIPRFSELSGQLLRLSTTDRRSFSKLTSIASIQDWTRAKADEYRQYTLALITIHNLAAPIHCLPTEVLERIFSYCWHDRKSLRLSHICSLWRSIILDRAAFWADAVTNCGPFFDETDELLFIGTLLSRSARHSRGISPFFYGFSPNIVKALAPYISNVVSLRVTLNSQSHLYTGLWPALCAGMQKLDAIHIELKKRVADISDEDPEYDYVEDEEDLMPYDHLEWDLDEETWGPLTILSRKNLPQLTRLTCPPSMITLFRLPLRHMKIVGSHGQIYADESDAPRRRLRPYRNSLETLEVVGRTMWKVARPAKAAPLHLPSLHSLRIESHDQKVICAILSWLEFPQTTRVHFIDSNVITLRKPIMIPRFETFFSLGSSAVLRSVIATIDRVIIYCPLFREGFESDSISCFAGDTERLHMENYQITPDVLVDVFGQNASIARLTLSLQGRNSLEVNFHAFPHLTHLDVAGPELDTIACMLGPTDKLPKGRAAPPALCSALAELVVTFALTMQFATAAPTAPKAKRTGRAATLRSGSSRATGPESEVDEALSQKCLVLQQVLARRASSGTRLTSLVLCVRPAMKPEHDMDEDPTELNPIWPSPAARQSVLASFQELVDGPVVLKLLDVSVEEDEA